MKRLLLVIGYLLITALAANAKGIPEQIDEDTAKEMLDAGKSAYRCKEVETDQGSVVTVSGEDIFTKAKPDGTRKKNAVRKAMKKGAKFMACQPLRINENTDSLANKRKSKATYVQVN